MDSAWEGGSGPIKRAPTEPSGRIQMLEQKLDMLALICQAMWEIMRDNGGVPEETLAAKVEEIDLRDGVLDGKATRGNTVCPRCGKVINRKHQRCLYCGADKPIHGVFDQL